MLPVAAAGTVVPGPQEYLSQWHGHFHGGQQTFSYLAKTGFTAETIK